MSAGGQGAALPARGLALVPAMLRMVRFTHTIFALPFAVAAAFLATAGPPPLVPFLWVLVAMVGARSLAMALNRLLDARIDAANPRTAGRELPSGALRAAQVWAFAAVSLGLLLLAVSQLPSETWVLWPVPVAAFVLYPLAKRVSWACHLVLGVTIGLAPVGAWLAITGELPLAPILLGLAVACWIAGFDIIYALLDIDFDRAHGVWSVPAHFGVARALWFTRALHAAAIALMVAAALRVEAGWIHLAGVAICAVVLAVENAIVRPDNTARIQVAFAHANGILAIIYVAAVLLDLAVA